MTTNTNQSSDPPGNANVGKIESDEDLEHARSQFDEAFDNAKRALFGCASSNYWEMVQAMETIKAAANKINDRLEKRFYLKRDAAIAEARATRAAAAKP